MWKKKQYRLADSSFLMGAYDKKKEDFYFLKIHRGATIEKKRIPVPFSRKNYRIVGLKDLIPVLNEKDRKLHFNLVGVAPEMADSHT